MFFNFCLLFTASISTYCLGLFFIRVNFFLNIINDKKFFIFQKIILGLFFVGFLNLLFNYFIKLNSLLIYILFIFIVFFEIYKSWEEFKKNFHKIFLFSLIFFPFTLILQIGWDGGLYHMPQQLILQNDKIIFGLTNIHNRYGLTGIYSYVVAPFWNANFLNFYTAIGSLVYSLLFLFFYEINQKKKIHYFLLTVAPLIFAFISMRYSPLSFTHVDWGFAVLFFISIFYGMLLLRNNDIGTKNNNLFFFLIVSFFTWGFKPSGVIILFYVGLLAIFFLRAKIFTIKKDINKFFFPIIFSIAWIVKTFINTGCFFYPIAISCMETSWTIDPVELHSMNEAIYAWNNYLDLLFRSFLINIKYFIAFVFSVPILFFIFFYYSRFLLKFLKNNNRYYYIFYINCLFLVASIVFFSKKIHGFSNLLSLEMYSKSVSLIISELIFLTITSGLLLHLFLLTFLKFKSESIPKLKKTIFSLNIIPFLIIIFFIFILLVKGQNPRFGIAVFLSLFSVLIFVFLNYVKNISFPSGNYFLYIVFVVLIGKLYFLDGSKQILGQNLIFQKKTSPEVITKKRKYFGYKPLQNAPDNPHTQNLCFASSDCYPYENVKKIYLKFKYVKFDRAR